MAKTKKQAKTPGSSRSKKGLSKKDVDILKLSVAEAMKKYQMGKQAVYDRRYALKRKVESDGININDMTTTTPSSTETTSSENTSTPKKAGRRGRPKKSASTSAAASVKSAPATTRKKRGPKTEASSTGTGKPIEINFENFSVRLNGVPKKISVNPDTNAIDIEM